MSATTTVMFTSCETGPDAWRHQEEMLREHFPQNDPAFALTDDPAKADLIFIGNLRPEQQHRKLRENPLLRRFAKKCFVLFEGDEPVRFAQGILTSLTKEHANLGRFRSGSYFLYHADFKNPFVERWYAERNARPFPPPTKRYLACFSGRACIPLRERLLNLAWRRPDVFIRDTTHSFDNFTHNPMGKNPAREAYFTVSLRSKFMLCPRGDGAASIRFFEAMQLGVAPVLISDDWVLPEGPDWSRCMLRIREDELDSLETTLERHEDEAAEIGREAQCAYENYFHGEAYVRYLIDSARSIQRTHAPLPERFFHTAWPAGVVVKKVERRMRRVVNRAVGAIRKRFPSTKNQGSGEHAQA